MYAARLWWMLRWLGHDAVAVLDGGLRPLDARAAADHAASRVRRPGDVPRPRSAARSSAPTRCSRALRATRRSCSTRASPERFRGETEPIDPVAGHIPGARQPPVRARTSPRTARSSPRTSCAPSSAMLGSRDAARGDRHQCGSGVTACHNMLAMEIAGLPGGRLYPVRGASGARIRRVRSRPARDGATNDTRATRQTSEGPPRGRCPLGGRRSRRASGGGHLALQPATSR